jgi:hypothetical protein
VTHGWSAFGGADHGWQDVGLEGSGERRLRREIAVLDRQVRGQNRRASHCFRGLDLGVRHFWSPAMQSRSKRTCAQRDGPSTLRLHDIIRHFLLDQAGKERLVAEHKCVGCENRHRARPPQRALGFGLRAVPAAGRAARLARLSSCHTAGSCCRLRVLDGRLVVGDANGHLHWLEIIT